MTKSPQYRVAILAIKVLVSAGGIAWLLLTVQWNLIVEKIVAVNWGIMGVAFALSTLCLLPCSLRWQKITHWCGYPMTLRESVYCYLVGHFFGAFLPTGQGGDVVRAVLASKSHGFSLGGIGGTILMERFIGLLVTIVLITFGSLMGLSQIAVLKQLLTSVSVLSIILVALITIYLNRRFRKFFLELMARFPIRRIRRVINDAVRVLDICRKNPSLILSTVSLSFLNQLLVLLAGFLMATAIPGFKAPWFSFPVVIPLIFIAVLLPSVGGYGVREASFVIFFGWFGVSEEAAVTYGILRLLSLWGVSLLGGILFLAGRSGGHHERTLASELGKRYSQDASQR